MDVRNALEKLAKLTFKYTEGDEYHEAVRLYEFLADSIENMEFASKDPDWERER